MAWNHSGRVLASCGSDKIVRVFTRHDGSRDQSRVFITGLPDIRTEGLLKGVEDQIKQSTPDYASVMITNWKALEG